MSFSPDLVLSGIPKPLITTGVDPREKFHMLNVKKFRNSVTTNRVSLLTSYHLEGYEKELSILSLLLMTGKHDQRGH